MGTPKVSILAPTFNPAAEHLRQALESLQRQTMQDWHVIIHDDASPTDVRSIVAPFLSDTRFSFERNPRRLGIGGNWNACLRKALSPVIQFLFQDDLWEPAFLEKGLAVLEKYPTVGFVSIDHDYRYEDTKIPADYYENLNAFKRANISAGKKAGEEFLRFWLGHDLRPGLIGEPSFVMIRRSLVERAGMFLEDMPQSLDNEYWIRCLLQSDWYYLKEPLGAFRVHSRSASAQHDRSGTGLTDRLRIYQLLLKTLPKRRPLLAEVEQSLKRALRAMIRRFFERRSQGKSVIVRGGGGKTVLSFAMRHPLLTGKALMDAARSK